MKKNVLSLTLLSVFASACTSMMYGNNVAPVNNQNTPYIVEREATTVYTPSSTTTTYPNNAQYAVAANSGAGSAYVVDSSRQEHYAQPSYSPYTTPSALAEPQTSRTATRDLHSVDDGWGVQGNQESVANEIQEPVAVRPPQREEDMNARVEPSTATPPAEPPRQQASNDTPSTQQSNNTAVSGNAVNSLLQRANSELGRGDLDAAAAYLEEAHRIDSRNANILYDIANIRYHQQRYREAESAAARAANIAGSGSVAKKSWSLIANARKALGDNQGAIAAAEKAASF